MSTKEINTKAMINMKEAATDLGISQMALRIRISKGKFPQPDHRIGTELFWSVDSLRGIVAPNERVLQELEFEQDLPF